MADQSLTVEQLTKSITADLASRLNLQPTAFMDRLIKSLTKDLGDKIIKKGLASVSSQTSSASKANDGMKNAGSGDSEPAAKQFQTRLLSKLDQSHLRLNEIRLLLEKVIDPKGSGNKREDKFPFLSGSINTFLKKFSTTSVRTEEQVKPKQDGPVAPVTELEKFQTIQPVEIQAFDSKALDSLGDKLTDILPKAIAEGMKGFNKKLSKLADSVEKSSGDSGGLLGGLLSTFADLSLIFGGKGRGLATAAKGLQRGGPIARGLVQARRGIAGIKKLPLGMAGKVGGGVLGTALAGYDFMNRKEEGQTTTQAAVGTGAGVAGGIAGAVIGQTLIPIPVVGAAIGGVVGSMSASWLADKMTGVGKRQTAAKKTYTASDREQHEKLENYVQSIGRYTSVREFISAVNSGKEKPIVWNPTTRQYEAALNAPDKGKSAPSIVPPVVPKDVKTAVNEQNKPKPKDEAKREVIPPKPKDEAKREVIPPKPKDEAKREAISPKKTNNELFFDKDFEKFAEKGYPKFFKKYKESKESKDKAYEGFVPTIPFLKSQPSSLQIKEREIQDKARESVNKEFDEMSSQRDVLFKMFKSKQRKDEYADKNLKGQQEADADLRDMEAGLKETQDLQQKMLDSFKSAPPATPIKDGVISNKGLEISTPKGELFSTDPSDVGVFGTKDTFGKLGELLKNSSKSQTIDNESLKITASEAKVTNNKLTDLTNGFNLLARALEKMGVNIGEKLQAPTIINTGPGNTAAPQGPVGVSQYTGDMGSPARAFTAYAQGLRPDSH